MLYQIIYNKPVLLYDGLEDEIKEVYGIDLNSDNFKLVVKDLKRLYQEEFKNILPEENFATLLADIKIRIKNPLPGIKAGYTGEDGLDIYWVKVKSSEGDYLALCSYGESQPMRYKLYLQAVFKQS